MLPACIHPSFSCCALPWHQGWCSWHARRPSAATPILCCGEPLVQRPCLPRASCFRRAPPWLAEMRACACFLAGASHFGETGFGGEPTPPLIHAHPIPPRNTASRAPLLSPCAAPYCARVRLAALGMSRIGTGSGSHARGASGAGSACAAVRDASIGPASPVRAVATAAEGKLTQNRGCDASDSPWCNVMRARSPDRIALACERSAALDKRLISECANGQSGDQGPTPEEED